MRLSRILLCGLAACLPFAFYLQFARAEGFFFEKTKRATVSQPKRIISVGLCADAWTVALAPRENIVAVTRGARNESISAYTEELKAFPVNNGQAESVYALKPDLVVADSYTRPSTISTLKRLGIKVAVLPLPTKAGDWRKPLMKAGEVFGAEDKARVIAEQMQSDLTALQAPIKSDKLAAIFRPGGYSPGGKTLAGNILQTSGARNLSDTLGRGGSEIMGLETLIYHKPDVIIHDYGKKNAGTLAGMLLKHPVLTDFMRNRETIDFPLKYWFCLTPKTFEAALRLKDSLFAAK